MLAAGTPRPIRALLVVIAASYAAVLLRNGFGVDVLWAFGWNYAYNATQLLAVVVCGVRAARCSGAERGAWTALTLGLFGFFAGDVYWSAVLAFMDSPPYPSPADAGYLSIYPGAYVALVLLLRARAGRVSSSLWLDGLIGAFAVAAIAAALVFGVVASTEGSPATVATNLGYPLGDLTLLAFVIAIMTVAGWRAGRTWMLIALGFAIFAVADTVYLYQTALGTYREYTILDATWPATYVLIAFAAWQPAKRLEERRLRGSGMLALPAGLALVSLGMLVLDHYSELNDVALWLATASVGLVVVRFALTFRENLRMLQASEAEATTDPLTGLGNRRALQHALARAAEDGAGATTVLALYDLDGFKSYNDAFGHHAGDALLTRLGHNVAAVLEGRGTAYRMGGDEFCVLAHASDAEAAAAVIADAGAALTEQGERFHVGCSAGTVLIGPDGTDADDALRLADQRMYANKRSGRHSREEVVHQVLLSVVGEHDSALRDHLHDVAALAVEVGRVLGLAEDELAHVRRAAALHDIGKVAIPDAILHAPRALEPDEWEYMRQHTIIGARIIGAAPELGPVADMVRASHERFDGGGYPDGVAGEEIPLGARIVAVCDSYDAMVTARPYRGALSTDEALAELRRCAGSQFDPAVVAAFEAVCRAAEREPALPASAPAA